MNDCGHTPDHLVALLRDEAAAERRRRLVERVEACESCAEELRTLRRAWDELPAAPDGRAPDEERERVLLYARDAVTGPETVTAPLWRVVRPAVLPAAAAVAAAAGVPVGVTACLASSGGDGWRVGLAEAAAFTLLALPVVGLQFGLDNVAVTGTVLAGVALGAAAGGVAGALAGGGRLALGAGG